MREVKIGLANPNLKIITENEGEYDILPNETRTDIPSNTITRICFQDGYIKEVGVNGVQIEDLIKICIHRLDSLQAEIPCLENERARNALKQALDYLDERTMKRIERGVDGTSNE